MTKFNKDFIRTWEKMKEKYGEDFEVLNGLSEGHLDNTMFLDKLSKTKVVADASIDSSANVKSRNINTIRKEMSKPSEKLVAFHKIFITLKKMFGLRVAKEWMEAEWNKALYLHDFHSSSFIPYCYDGTNIITIKYQNTIYKVSFEQLLQLMVTNERATFDETLNTNVYNPSALYVLDLDEHKKEQWTKVTRVLKHDNNELMHFVKLANGKSVIVTANHPMITETKKEIEDRIYTSQSGYFDNSLFTDTASYLPKGHKTKLHTEEIELSEDFGWLVGFILADGVINNYGCSFKQNEGLYLDKAFLIMDKLNIPYICRDDGTCSLYTNKYSKWLVQNFKKQHASDKKLPINYCHWNYKFLNAVISGFADGDASSTNNSVIFRVTTNTLLNQFAEYFSFLGGFPRFRTPMIPSEDNQELKEIKAQLPLHILYISLRNDSILEVFRQSLRVQNSYKPLIRSGNFKNKQYIDEDNGFMNVLDNKALYEYDLQEVYDITTESGHFICNGMLSHNCFAYDLTRMVEEGLFWLPDQKYAPAKHLETFVDFVKEFINFNANLTSGACGLPNLLPYMYYFWNKDVNSKHYPRCQNPKTFAKSQIQRLIFGFNQPYTRDRLTTVR